jgi:hypothetical protein
MPSALAKAFDAEKRDGAWAATQRSNLLDAVRKIDRSQAAVDEVECRTTLCRVTGNVADASQRETFMKHALMGPSATFATIPLAFYAPGVRPGDSSFSVYFLRQ